MKRNKVVTFLLGLMLILSLASVGQAAMTFDLNLSNLNGPLGVSLADVENIDFIDFYGRATIVQTPIDLTTGTFTQSGSVTLEAYNDTATEFSLNGAELKINFTNLSGTYNGNFVTFNPNQNLTLSYVYGATVTPLAVFGLGINSGGFVLDPWGNSLAQTYYLTLTNDTYSIFSGSAVDFEAILTASDFRTNGKYQMMGQVSAVPVPGTLILISSGLIGLIGFRKRTN